MNQRGQFYLIAALLAVAVLLSVGSVFTRAKVPQEDPSVEFLASEMQDEVAALIARDAFQGNASDALWSRVEGLTQNYSRLNPTGEIVIFYGNYTQLGAKSYTQSQGRSLTSGFTANASTIILTYDAFTYTFIRNLGNEYHLLLKKEGEHGATVATR